MRKYREGLTANAKERRKNQTLGERWVWLELRDCRAIGLVFRREQPFGDFILDFYCSSLNLNIEIDGASHNVDASKDRARDAWLGTRGIRVLRFSSPRNRSEAKSISDTILATCRQYGWTPTNEPLRDDPLP